MTKKQKINPDEIRTLFANCEIVDGKIRIKSDFIKWVILIKELFHFIYLEEINVIKLKNEEIELTYTFYSKKDDETVILAIIAKNTIHSLRELFKNADSMEKIISKNFNIKFES